MNLMRVVKLTLKQVTLLGYKNYKKNLVNILQDSTSITRIINLLKNKIKFY